MSLHFNLPAAISSNSPSILAVKLKSITFSKCNFKKSVTTKPKSVGDNLFFSAPVISEAVSCLITSFLSKVKIW